MIPMRLGVRFGYDFEIRGAKPNSSLALRCVVEHPPMHMPDGSVRTKVEYECAYDTDADGVALYGNSYQFTDPYELVPGRWTRAHYLGSRRLMFQAFEVQP